MNHATSKQPDRNAPPPEAFPIPIWLYAAAFFCASLLVTGLGVFLENHAFHVALVRLLNDASLYPHDPYAPALARYASMLWPAVAWAARFVPLEPLLLGSLLAERFLLLYAVARLARAFAPRSRLAPVAAMAVVACGILPLLGGGTVMLAYFDQTGFALAFLILAVAELLESRRWLFAIWLAIGFNVQSMYGIFALSYCGLALITNEACRRDWKKWAASLALFFCLATPAIFFGYEVFKHGGGDDALWLTISRVRCPWHLYPLTWSMQSYLRFGASMLLLLGLLGERKKEDGRLFQLGVAWSGMAILWLFLAFFAAYVAKSPSLLVLQAARATDLWLCFAAVMIAATLALRIEENAINGWPWKTAVIALFTTLLFWRPLNPLMLYALAVGVVAFVLEPFCTAIFANGRPGRVAAVLAASVSMIALHDAAVRTVAAHGIKRGLFPRSAPGVEASATWARAHTPVSAVFLVDPASEDWEMFRGLAERSVFTTFIEGGAIHWDRSFVTEWVERMRAFGVDLTQTTEIKDAEKAMAERYQHLRDQDVAKISTRYPIDYWIVPDDHESNFPTVFKTHGFKLLKVSL